jgi:hypothetical protein
VRSTAAQHWSAKPDERDDRPARIKRHASAARARYRHVRAAQEVRELAGVGHCLISVTVVYARLSAALSRESAGQRRAFGEIYQDINRDQHPKSD